MKNTSYYLFGEELVSEYEMNNNPANMALIIKQQCSGAIKQFTHDAEPSEILSAYDGWGMWVQISEDEYNAIKENL
jgi:hypothetical protein